MRSEIFGEVEIRKYGDKWCVYRTSSKRCFWADYPGEHGCYLTKGAAVHAFALLTAAVRRDQRDGVLFPFPLEAV